MPSKKNKNSKGRGKAAKKIEKQGESLDTQMEQMKIDEDSQTNMDEDALLEEAIKLAAAEKEEMDAAAAEKEEEQLKVCHHGNAVETKELVYFINLFTKSFSSKAFRRGGSDLLTSIEVAIDAVVEKYPNVWNDPSKLKLVASYFLSNGTHYVLQGDFDMARCFAVIAGHFETGAAYKSGEEFNLDTHAATILEVKDERTLVKYLRKRIPCSCLDEIYKNVKTMTRKGVCYNCSSTIERNKMLTCARCGEAHYCSRSCQKDDWPMHKERCENLNAKQAF